MKSRHDLSKTKIIATIGPACSDIETLRKFFEAGIDVCRLNFSHGKHEIHDEVIKKINFLNKEFESNVAILADLQGPKIRVGEIEGDSILLKDGAEIILTSELCLGNTEKIYISYDKIANDVKPGENILLDDGKIKLQILKTDKKTRITARIINGGKLTARKGVNLPNTKLSTPSLTKKDLEDLDFILSRNIDWIALSFVRTAEDIEQLRNIIRSRNKNMRVVAKIEKPEALVHLDKIMDTSDAIMVARGDLGVEVSFNKIPLIQKQIVNKAIMKAKPVIIATQMLESMIVNFSPTRAEANDVANAVFDGADTLMLSGETSVGKFPVGSIQVMQSIIDYAEGKEFVLKHETFPVEGLSSFLPDTICYNACKMADMAHADAIILFSYSGATVFRIARYRPTTNLFVFTPNENLVNQLSLVWGIKAFYLPYKDPVDQVIEETIEILKKKQHLKRGNVVIHVGSLPLNERKETNWIKVNYVE